MAEEFIPTDLNPIEKTIAEHVLRGVSGILTAGFYTARLIGLSKAVKNTGPAPKEKKDD